MSHHENFLCLFPGDSVNNFPDFFIYCLFLAVCEGLIQMVSDHKCFRRCDHGQVETAVSSTTTMPIGWIAPVFMKCGG